MCAHVKDQVTLSIISHHVPQSHSSLPVPLCSSSTFATSPKEHKMRVKIQKQTNKQKTSCNGGCSMSQCHIYSSVHTSLFANVHCNQSVSRLLIFATLSYWIVMGLILDSLLLCSRERYCSFRSARQVLSCIPEDHKWDKCWYCRHNYCASPQKYFKTTVLVF